MRAARRWFLFACWMFLVAAGHAADGLGVPRDVGSLPRPGGQVYDPDGWLTVMERRELDMELGAMRERDGVDLKVAILTKKPDIPGPPFAERLAAAWGQTEVHGLVLHVAGSDGPWLAVGGELPKMAGRQVVDDLLREASRRVAGERDEHRRVGRAVQELSDFLRFLGNRGLYHEERSKTQRLEGELRRTRRELAWKLGLLGGVFATGLLVAVGMAVWRQWRRHRSPLWFPETVWRKRFGAPFCGGGDAVVRFGDPRARK